MQLDNLVVASGRRRLQCAAAPPSFRVDVGPFAEQQLDDLVVTSGRRRLQSAAVPPSLRVDVNLAKSNRLTVSVRPAHAT